jgi:hypothetical protein
MGRDAAHRVDGDGAGGEARVRFAAEVGPGLGDGEAAIEGGVGDFRREGADAGRREAGPVGHGFGGVVVRQATLEEMVEHGAVAVPGAGEVRADAWRVEGDRRACAAVEDEGLAGSVLEEEAVSGRIRV